MEIQTIPFSTSLSGISEKTIEIHHDKLYAGYVKKSNEIEQTLQPLEQGGDVSTANQTYSTLRSLKTDETFARNGVYLHEHYFAALGGDGNVNGSLVQAIVDRFGSFEAFQSYFSACGMAARGWVVLAWDTNVGSLQVYTADAHNHGGVWGAVPVLVLDVYEHAYYIDYGSDRKAYIEDFWKNINWQTINEQYEKAIHAFSEK